MCPIARPHTPGEPHRIHRMSAVAGATLFATALRFSGHLSHGGPVNQNIRAGHPSRRWYKPWKLWEHTVVVSSPFFSLVDVLNDDSQSLPTKARFQKKQNINKCCSRWASQQRSLAMSTEASPSSTFVVLSLNPTHPGLTPINRMPRPPNKTSTGISFFQGGHYLPR